MIRVNNWINRRHLSIINDYLEGIDHSKFEFSKEIICEKYNLKLYDLDNFLEDNLSVLILTDKCKKCNKDIYTSYVKRKDILSKLDYVPKEIEICKTCKKKIDDEQKALNEQKIKNELEEKIKNETKNSLQFGLSKFDASEFEKIIELKNNIVFEKGKTIKVQGSKLDDDSYVINIK
ncbi:hypothetical protein OBJ96_04110 [Empedobacter falsenii]